MKRRQVLKSFMALGALGLNACSGIKMNVDANGEIALIELPKQFDEIDHFHITHAVRDGKRFSVPEPSLHKDVVIVGGGISGLTALKSLMDFDTLLVEKESAIGGNSRRRQANGIFYPLGAIVSQGAIAPFTDYFNELAIPFQALNDNDLLYHIKGQNVPNPLNDGWQQLPLSADERESFRKLGEDLAIYADPVNGLFFPRSDNKPAIKALDRITFKQYLADKHYAPATEEFMNLLLSSRLGENGDKVSAWITLYILAAMKQAAYTLPGGHGVISEKLREHCLERKPNSILTDFTVTHVENKSNGKVWVTGVHADGSLQTIAAKSAVMAVPKVYAKHVVQGLAQDRPELYQHFQYNAYLVAQVELKQRIAQAFETVSNTHFSRFIVAADWLDNNRNSSGLSHMTVYVPYPGTLGRISLYGESVEQLAKTIISDLHDIMPESRGLIKSIYLHRWGHPMVSCTPGMDKVCDEAKQPFGRVVFAHSDSFGISGLYSAVWAGMEASADCRIVLEEQSA